MGRDDSIIIKMSTTSHETLVLQEYSWEVVLYVFYKRDLQYELIFVNITSFKHNEIVILHKNLLHI